MKKIMIATDGSEGAGRAVEVGARLAHDLGAQLMLLTVAGDLPADEMRKLAHSEGDIGGALDSAAEQILAEATMRANRNGATSIKRRFLWGNPAEAIISEAKREGVDLLVVGRRGRGRLAGLLLGSVSQKVASLQHCPVLVVP